MPADFQRYWLMIHDDNALSRALGTGFRGAIAKVGRKWVTLQKPFDDGNTRIPKRLWDDTPHVIARKGDALKDVLEALRSKK